VNLTDLETFVLVATAGSLTAAAKELAVPKSTISRRVRRLEEAIGLPLVSRTPNRLHLTEQGELLRDRCAPALMMVADAERELHGLASEPAGLLRLTTLETLSHAPALTRILLSFQRRYPRVKLEVVATDSVLDLAEARMDLALRTVGGITEDDGRLAARVLGRLDAGLYACPRYLDQHGTPEALDELSRHVRVAHTPTMRKGLRLVSPNEKPRLVELKDVALRSTSFGPVLHATLLGATIGILPTFLADPEVERGRLVPLFEPWRVQGAMLGVVRTAQRTVLPKTRAFIHFLAERAAPEGLVCPV
jgi:LysR family transcriptional regulator for bpeEF and oprC